MRRLNPFLASVASVAAAAAMAACGGSAPSPVDPLADVLTSDAAPLDAVLVEALGTDDLDRYRYDIERDAEAALVECMAAAGFEFFIADPLPPRPTRAELESPEFAAEQGFGVVSGFRAWIEDLDVEGQQRDRNGEYLRSLSGGEIQRYLVTLDGEPPEPGQLPDEASCRARATVEAYHDWQRFLDLVPHYTAIGEERDTHPDWVAARDDWRACMAERGLDYAEPDAIRSDVTRRMNDSVVAAYPDGNLPLVRRDGDWVVDPEVEPLLDELAAFEVSAATANVSCTEPLQERFDAVEREVQQAFVDRNRDPIEELLSD